MKKDNYLDNLYVVLVETKTPGNIGSSVRAMKNMGISHLRLVNPTAYRDDDEQIKFGYRSQDIIENAEEFDTLADALADITLVFLATSKKGKWKKDFLVPDKAGEVIASRIKKDKIAIVFGREESGVTIDESQLANYYIYIPSAVSYPSLNLSQAVMVLMYEIYRHTGTYKGPTEFPKMAAKSKYTRIGENIWNLMKTLEFKEGKKGLFHRSLKRSLSRTHWTNADIAVFDRICKQVRWFIDGKVGSLSKEKENGESLQHPK